MSLTYCRPSTLSEALLRLRETGAAPYAGGTDLLLKMRRDIDEVCLVDIKNLSELRVIQRDDKGRISIGAASTMTELRKSDLIRSCIPALAQAAETMGCREIQNRATIGGNLANASPSAETAVALLVYNAEVHLISDIGERIVPLSQFLVAPGKTRLMQGELITRVTICSDDTDGSISRYARASRVRGMDLATVSLAVWFNPACKNKFRIAAGAVLPVASRMDGLEAYLSSQETVAEEQLSHAKTLFTYIIQPRSNSLRGAPEEKRFIGGALLVTTLQEVMTALGQEGGGG